MRDSDRKGIVFNIQKFSVHDGVGLRTTVFLKGCPLRCRWCSNPESQLFTPERAYNPNRCLSAAVCGRCVEACTDGGLSLMPEGRIRFDRASCSSCGACVHRCPTGAQTFYGEERSVGEIIRKVEEDDVFYSRSGGGLTLSGGEPLAQPDFALALLREAKRPISTPPSRPAGITPPRYWTKPAACSTGLSSTLRASILKSTRNIPASATSRSWLTSAMCLRLSQSSPCWYARPSSRASTTLWKTSWPYAVSFLAAPA